MDEHFNWLRRLSKLYSFKGAAKAGAVVVIGTLVATKYKNKSDRRVFAYSTPSSSSSFDWGQSWHPKYNWHQTENPEKRPEKWDSNWDRREPASRVRPPKTNAQPADLTQYEKNLESATPTATRHIILIRHGQYFDTAVEDKDRFLTELGREQAVLTGNRLKLLDLPYTSLTSSTMTRAIETAELIHKHIPALQHVTDDCLREGAPIPPEPPIGSWRPEPKFFQDGARIESAFRKYFHRANPTQTEDSYEIIVCHANVIRYFICRALQFSADGWLRFSLAHGSLTHLVIRPNGNVHIRCLGDVGYMKEKEITFS